MKLRDRRRRAAWSRQIHDWLAVRGITLVHPEGDTFEALRKPALIGCDFGVGDATVVIRGEASRVEGVRIVEDLARHGTAISQGGKRIDPSTIYAPPPRRRTIRRSSAMLALAALAIIGKP